MAGAKLVIRNGGFDGMEYPIEAEETLIGRNPTTDVTLLDENISREHALILFDPESGVYTIEDLQSTNGTKVNGKGIRSHQLSRTERSKTDPRTSSSSRSYGPY